MAGSWIGLAGNHTEPQKYTKLNKLEHEEVIGRQSVQSFAPVYLQGSCTQDTGSVPQSQQA